MKKVLIVTYYWPPAGGPGVQRILNMVKYLPDYGYEPIVLTVKNPSAPARDESLLSYIPNSCKIYKTKTSEPFEAYKKLTGKKSGDALPKNISFASDLSLGEKLSRWIRANLFIPDARKGWKKHVLREGLKIIKKENPDIILSTSPPHSVQVAAMHLAQKSKLPWVADLRDPWTEAYWESKMPKTKRSETKNKKYEKEALDTADLITTVGEGISTLLQKKTATPVAVIYNGYRDLDYSKVESGCFEILHLGNLSSMQSLDELLEAIKRLKPELRQKIKLRFIGTLAKEHRDKVDKLALIKKEYCGFMPYDKMIQEARSASMLYLPRLNSTYSKSLISAKIFDYLALRRPILAIADKDSDISHILKDSESGRSFEKNEIDDIKKYIEKSILEPTSDFINATKLRTYSLKNNISVLSRKFNQLIS